MKSYTDIALALNEAHADLHPAQVHGLLCGYICATSGKLDASWEKIIFNNNEASAGRELLREVYETSYHQMSEFSFEFSLILPADDVDINARTEALGLWCQGFLTGLKQCQVPLENREAGEVTDTLNDFMEIAQVNFGNIADDDEDETAYFELVEYVRLGVLMIFQDLKTNSSPPIADENGMLH